MWRRWIKFEVESTKVPEYIECSASFAISKLLLNPFSYDECLSREIPLEWILATHVLRSLVLVNKDLSQFFFVLSDVLKLLNLYEWMPSQLTISFFSFERHEQVRFLS